VDPVAHDEHLLFLLAPRFASRQQPRQADRQVPSVCFLGARKVVRQRLLLLIARRADSMRQHEQAVKLRVPAPDSVRAPVAAPGAPHPPRDVLEVLGLFDHGKRALARPVALLAQGLLAQQLELVCGLGVQGEGLREL
jgi:hypothetical protein